MSETFRNILGAIVLAITVFGVMTYWQMNATTRQEEQQALKFKIDLTPEQQQDKVLLAGLERLVNACPGLQNYSPDLSRALVAQDSGYYFYRDHQGISVTFNVAENPTHLPPPLNVRAARDSCYLDINGDRTEVSIAKSACKSICNGQWIDGGDNLIIALK